jgi:BirA family biotin operon repressor/biotin-[acetyl-CoA-carboxylase] ligase
MPVGRPHRHFRTVGSTNEVARRLAAAGAADGTVVTSELQTQGRGRQGRSWLTPAGSSLAWSLLLRRKVQVPGTLPLQIGVAVCEAVESFGAGPARLKWPNDVWLQGKKCAGILVEARPQDGWAVVGVGLNLSVAEEDFPEELRSRAVSIGKEADVRTATAALNRFVARRLDAGIEETLTELADRDALKGKMISWQHPAGGSTAAPPVSSGTAVGIDGLGNLLVETGNGTISLNAGEVHLDVGG